VTAACAFVLVRRLSTALALVAALVFGLHELADAGSPPGGGALFPALQLEAAPDHAQADRGPVRHVVIQDSVRASLMALCLAMRGVAATPAATVRAHVAPDLPLTGDGSGGPLRPPRASVRT